ncbi:death-associated protein 1 [Grus japonensis]|uniref:Death-associated protein 1 n=1 Tax=Grus japonensis TaxID=30415 RepID=A0ABC9WDN2_GRUJA
MSSPPKEKAETRAGHPPAVKAGGMRIVQKHPHNSDAKEEKDKDDQDWETSRWEFSSFSGGGYQNEQLLL